MVPYQLCKSVERSHAKLHRSDWCNRGRRSLLCVWRGRLSRRLCIFGFWRSKTVLAPFSNFKRLPWAALFVLTGAALAQIQPWFLHNWEQEFKVEGPGGFAGKWIGNLFLQNVLGQIGSVIALLVIYLISLIWLTGIRPILIIKQTVLGIRSLFRKIAQEGERKRLEASDERQRLEANQKKIEREIRRQERMLKKQGVVPTS